MREGELLWEPSRPSKMAAYMEARGFSSYDELWRWSVEDLEGFWGSIWDEYGLGPRPAGPVLARDSMPGAVWFPEARLNYAEYLLGMGRPGEVEGCASGRAGRLRQTAMVSA
ncbi:MAG: acetyl-coenzyme A synthetase N-terminal domain-containing protein, partial [Thermoleophilaceae bacterium]